MNLDPQQILVKKRLDELSFQLKNNKTKNLFLETLLKIVFSKNLAKKLIKNYDRKKHKNKSLYIYGGVGRGKTMLMKEFFSSLKNISKCYFHFNSFMLDFHNNIHELRKNNYVGDEFSDTIKNIVGSAELICFDEFQVFDIADAMIMARIFTYFSDHKISVVITSNSHPKNLYSKGIQREIFLDFINNILLKNYEILHLDSLIDYRKSNSHLPRKFYFVDDKNNSKVAAKIHAEFDKMIKEFTANKTRTTKIIKIFGREIKIKNSFEDIAVIDFKDLCEKEYYTAEYRMICRSYKVIFLKDIPCFDEGMKNEMRRFTLFIDEAYENKNVLVILAKAEPNYLCKIKNDVAYFERTVSRIIEITS